MTKKPRDPVRVPEEGCWAIMLATGQHALVDDEMVEALAPFGWSLSSWGYAQRGARKPDGRKFIVFMHREVLLPPPGFFTDHINGNKLDNRRRNLRVATAAQNQWNRAPQTGNKSGFKGVSFNRVHGKWQARIQAHGRKVHLGWFERVEDAAAAYAEAARRLHGEFANVGGPK